MYKVLTKTLVAPFYRQNALAFAMVLLVAGGFMRSDDHIALAREAVRSPFLLSMYVLLWTLYSLFATRFAGQQIHRYDVLLHLRLYPAWRRWWALWRIQLELLAPIILYGLLVGRFGWVGGQQQMAVVLITVMGLVLFLLSTGTLGWYEYVLRHPHPVRPWAGWLGTLRRRFQTPYLLFGIQHLMANMATVFWRTKIATSLVWLGILKLYATDQYQINLFRTPDYDLRLIGLGGLIIGLSQASLIYELYRFEQDRLMLYRNMPVSDWVRWFRYVGQFALLLLPETLLFFYHLPVGEPVWSSVGALVFAVSLPVLLYGLFLRVPRQLGGSLPHLYILMIAYFLLIMFRVPLWLLAGGTFAAAGWLFKRYYWQSAWQEH